MATNTLPKLDDDTAPTAYKIGSFLRGLPDAIGGTMNNIRDSAGAAGVGALDGVSNFRAGLAGAAPALPVQPQGSWEAPALPTPIAAPVTAPRATAPVAAAAPENGDARANFTNTYGALAATTAEKLGTTAENVLGHWGHETGWGKSIIPGTNNLGNIKDFSGGGVAATDNMTGTSDKYRAFATPEEFADHYSGLMARKYPGTMNTTDAAGFTKGLGGYATDPAYAAKLQKVIGGVSGLGTLYAGAAPAPMTPEAQRLALWDAAGAIGPGNGAGAVSSGGGSVGPRGIVDPSAAIRTGFNQQLNYQQAALQNIMDAARGGDSRNYSYRLAHMIGAMGQNNFAGLQTQGADAMNNANVNAYGSELVNEASHNSVDNLLKMERERSDMALKQAQMQTRQGGTTTNMVGGIPINSVTEALAPKIDSKGMVTWDKVGASADRAAAKTGIHVDASGNRREYFPDGTFKDLPKAK